MRDYCTLLRQALNGDSQAFGELASRFQDFALVLAQRKLGDFHLAQDAVQEAFLATYLKLHTLHELDAFPSWFGRVVERSCSKVRRRHGKIQLVFDMDEAEAVADERSSPLEIVTRYQDRAMVARILEMLSGREREACVLRFMHGMSYRDIAGHLNIPEGTLKRRLHTARNRLIQLVERERGRIIRVGYMPISDHLLAMVAQERNQAGDMNIRLQRFLSWSALVKALRNQLVDVAFVMAPLAMDLHSKGLAIRYVLDGHHDGSAVTFAPGARTKRNGGLPGSTRWALPHPVSTHKVLLRHLVAAHGHSSGNGVKAKYVSPSYVIRSLKQQEIDAFFCAEPWCTKSEAEGTGLVATRSRDIIPGHICCVVVAGESFAVHHGDLLRDYLHLLLDAGTFIRQRPEAAAAIQSRYTGVERSIARHVLDQGHIRFDELAPSRDRAGAAMQLALDTAVLKRSCDLNSFFKPMI